MQPTSNQDYKQLLTAVIKKQIVILGPDITLSKARNVRGLIVADDGTVTNVQGQAQEVTQALIDQFVQLSGLIVKKTMEPLLSLSQNSMSSATPSAPSTPAPEMQQSTLPTTPEPVAQPAAMPQTAPVVQPVEQPISPVLSGQNQQSSMQTPGAQNTAIPTPVVSMTQQSAPVATAGQGVSPAPSTQQQPVSPAPASNPLAAQG